jgi:GDP-L-fucose synthase
MRTYESEQLVNIGCGADVTIRELAELVARAVGYAGRLEYDATKPDGTPRKLLDVGRLSGLGWKARISLEDGVADTYRWFVANEASIRRS